ncbi:MAG: MaoC family dehydratase N-terminal domain-containing protein [Desulfatibacillum sp.]|nr:MaoC family dehydratase N-terminal domain-containing protein [Desulfatibacillum sp.]
MKNTGLYCEDVSPGDALPTFELKVTRTHIVKFAGAGGDFNPIHHDEEYAKALGLPSVFAMGLMSAGYLSRVITDWAGVENVKRYKVRYSGIVWPGDILTFGGQVGGKAGDRGIVSCELHASNQNGEKVIEAEAEVLLPRRNA